MCIFSSLFHSQVFLSSLVLTPSLSGSHAYVIIYVLHYTPPYFSGLSVTAFIFDSINKYMWALLWESFWCNWWVCFWSGYFRCERRSVEFVGASIAYLLGTQSGDSTCWQHWYCPDLCLVHIITILIWEARAGGCWCLVSASSRISSFYYTPHN